MDVNYELKYHKLEEKNWWFISRRSLITQLIKKNGIHKSDKILEVGCAGGPLIKILAAEGYSNITGIDLSENAIELCKKRGIENAMVMDAAKTLFKDNEFDLLIASDILEHIEDDHSALAEWKRILKPNGILIVFVPAFSFLWSNHDVINHHFRRYSKGMLKGDIEKANLTINTLSFWNFSLFLPVCLLRLIQNKQKNTVVTNDHLYELNPFINKMLIYLLKVENFLLRFIRFPFGVSVFAVCKK